MYNKVILMGRITKDLELKTTQSGISVLSFTIAVDRRFTDKGGDRQADFINCVAWRQRAEFISKFFYKGRMILIDGELQTRNYKDKDGKTVYVTEVIVERADFTGEKKDQQTNAEYISDELPSEKGRVNSSDEPTDKGDDYPF